MSRAPVRIPSKILALLLICVSTTLAAPPPSPLLHKPAPQFVKSDLKGKSIHLSTYKGRVVLLTFWATWCAPCLIEMPRFIAWQNELGPRGLQIIAVSMDDDAAPVQALLHKRPVNYPVLMGDEGLGRLYGGVLGLPVTFLIDRTGIITGVYKGESNLDKMHHEVQRLLEGR